MTCKIKRIVSVLCLVAAIVSVVFLPVSGFCETLRFVFLADSRGDSLTEPINTPVLNAIIAQIKALSPQPAFVVFGGDREKHMGSLIKRLKYWRAQRRAEHSYG